VTLAERYEDIEFAHKFMEADYIQYTVGSDDAKDKGKTSVIENSVPLEVAVAIENYQIIKSALVNPRFSEE